MPLAATLGLVLAMVVWAAAPQESDAQASTRLEPLAGASTPPTLPRPSEPVGVLPSAEAALQPVQPLVPAAAPARAERAADAGGTGALASIDLALREPDGEPAIGVKLIVHATKPQTRIVAGPVWSGADGRFVQGRLPADTRLLLRFTDRTGNTVLEPLELTLAAGENRVLTETVRRGLTDIVVEVRDRLGRPVLEPVTVTLVAAFMNRSTRTLQTIKEKTEGGSVSFPRLAAESVAVAAELDGFAPTWLPDTPVDRDPMVLVLSLDPGFPVEVEIVDEHGAPRDVDAVNLRGSPVGVQARRVAPGRFRFPAFPEAATGITASAQGRHWSIAHDAKQPLARLVVPAAGSLAVSWDPPPPARPLDGLFIYSEPPGWGWYKPIDAATSARGGPVEIEDLAPGEYRLELPHQFYASESRTTRVTVQSGQVTRLQITP